jgi:hypothetical protein
MKGRTGAHLAVNTVKLGDVRIFVEARRVYIGLDVNDFAPFASGIVPLSKLFGYETV